MSSERRLAVSYSRFSDPKQAKGDSQERQDEMFRAFCQRHNLTPCNEVFADNGRSGYKDDHRRKGRLGDLVAAAEDGRFEPGTIIVVEGWDRLGRLRPDKQTALVADLLKTGVSIGICRLDDIFCEDDFGTHKWTVLATFIQLAFQESRQKADRVASSWEARRKRAREKGGLLTGRLPAWLEMVDGKARVIPERAAVVVRVFELAASGFGGRHIVETLIREKVPPFGKKVIRPGRRRSQFAGKWTRSYIALLLDDRRVLGRLQPRRAVNKPGEPYRDVPSGEPLEGVFPAVVKEDLFLRARAARAGRDRGKKGRGRGPREGRHVNLFRSLLTHARDGGTFILHTRGSRKKPVNVLINATAEDGQAERYYTFPYPVFEAAVLRLLAEIRPDDVLPRKGAAPSRAEVLRAQLQFVRADMERIKGDLATRYSRGLADVLVAKEAEEEALGRELQDEMAKTVAPAVKAWRDLPSLAGLVEKEGDVARLRLRPVLRRLVESAHVLLVRRSVFTFCAAQFVFSEGDARRTYLIVYKSAGNGRRGGWWASSLSPDLMRHQGFDLRDPAHVTDLVEALETASLESLIEFE
jgi:DNA invertase Pin-like site-specific DNA recombinase